MIFDYVFFALEALVVIFLIAASNMPAKMPFYTPLSTLSTPQNIKSALF